MFHAVPENGLLEPVSKSLDITRSKITFSVATSCVTDKWTRHKREQTPNNFIVNEPNANYALNQRETDKVKSFEYPWDVT